MSSQVFQGGAPNIIRTERGRYLVGNVIPSHVDADTAAAYFLDLAQRILNTERAHLAAEKKVAS
jgi:hypothetical protein